jgi:hypothetical protein
MRALARILPKLGGANGPVPDRGEAGGGPRGGTAPNGAARARSGRKSKGTTRNCAASGPVAAACLTSSYQRSCRQTLNQPTKAWHVLSSGAGG